MVECLVEQLELLKVLWEAVVSKVLCKALRAEHLVTLILWEEDKNKLYKAMCDKIPNLIFRPVVFGVHGGFSAGAQLAGRHAFFSAAAVCRAVAIASSTASFL